ncbi:MAG: hypothetical protein K6F72_01745 [Bacteroidales bacterium]|nr:hypothetical protein [Bacteroidales bacterium]
MTILRMTSYKKLLRCLALFAVLLTPIATAWGQTLITNIAGLNAMTENGNYIITADIEDASTYTTKASFTGILTAQAKPDGTFPVISGLRHPPLHHRHRCHHQQYHAEERAN